MNHFWQNSNIELNQIGYRPPLTDMQLEQVGWGLGTRLVEAALNKASVLRVNRKNTKLLPLISVKCEALTSFKRLELSRL